MLWERRGTKRAVVPAASKVCSNIELCHGGGDRYLISWYLGLGGLIWILKISAWKRGKQAMVSVNFETAQHFKAWK